MTDEPNLLGDYLRARRELVTPEQAGIPVVGVRRVPGLRREEVAMLAGISADYYLRLEQGRDRNPSVQVLESLARVLQLDDERRRTCCASAADKPRRAPRRPRRETVPPGHASSSRRSRLPAFVEGRYFDVLAANRPGDRPVAAPRGGRQPAAGPVPRPRRAGPATRTGRARPGAWSPASASPSAPTPTTPLHRARRRALPGQPPLPPALGPPRRGRARRRRHAPRHPQVGELRLNRERLGISGTAGQMLVIYHPDPGTDSADKLALLASATQTPAVS